MVRYACEGDVQSAALQDLLTHCLDLEVTSWQGGAEQWKADLLAYRQPTYEERKLWAFLVSR